MRESKFPKPAGEIVSTLTDVFRHQNQLEVVEILENAEAEIDEIEFDNWNGGTTTWRLRLEIPASIFAKIEVRIGELEGVIEKKASYFFNPYPNDRLGGVSIGLLTASSVRSPKVAPPEVEIRRLWGEGRMRLFLSHIHTDKIFATQLKTALRLRGIEAFVAHEDIEPAAMWQSEIELGLKSAHVLAALLTPDFQSSKWTNHEIGWALGRGIPVLMLRVGADPYGLVGKYQAIAGNRRQPNRLAAQIAQAILVNVQLQSEMRRCLLSTLISAESREMAEASGSLFLELGGTTQEEKEAVWRACETNPFLKENSELLIKINAVLGNPPKEVAQGITDDDIPF